MSQDGKRIIAMDLARGLAVFFMILVHVEITFSTAEVDKSVFGQIIEFLGGPPAAPVFMAMMGVSFCLSRNRDLKSGVMRGLKIFLLGYVLNILRGVLPIMLADAFAPGKYAQIPPEVANLADAFWEIDILQFAGLALIAMAILRELKAGPRTLLALASRPGSGALAAKYPSWAACAIFSGATSRRPRSASATSSPSPSSPG
jgi:hypothetical protein